MITWHPDIIAHLNSHGFNIRKEDLWNAEQDNTRYRFLRLIRPHNFKSDAYDVDNRGLRFRLYTDGFLWQHKPRWKNAVKSLTVDISRPNWRRSVDRWVSLAVMTLTEASMEVEEQESNERRRLVDRAAAARAALDGTGVSVRDITTTFGFEWGGDNYSKLEFLGSLTLRPSKNQPLDEAIAKAARLIVFLQQENWIIPQPDSPDMAPKQLFSSTVVYPNVTSLAP